MKPRFDFVQYSPEYWDARRGVPTASEFKRIMTAKTMKLAAGHDSYIDQLIADTIAFDPNFMTERPVSRAMEEGTRREPESRFWYERHTGRAVTQVGFCLSDDETLGCSPDGLIGDGEGVLELKNCDLATHVSYLRAGKLPDEYQPQVHGHLIVTGATWCDWVSYHPACHKQLVIRVEPDEFTKKLRDCLGEFVKRYAEAKAKVLQML